jgi:nicotinate-nucleotide--dimethylbenzimidazole phosphoribosyltransferase
VSAYPAEVTAQMLATLASGRAAVTVLAARVGADLRVVDAGVRDAPDLSGVVRLGLGPSQNLAREPALSDRDVQVALEAGRAEAAAAARDGMTVVVGGELGIANTTAATALACWLTARAPEAMTGPGTGLDAAGVEHKSAVIARALALHTPEIDGPLAALQRLGGAEIAVLCGLALGAGEHGLGYVCDGLIATAAAAVAVSMVPDLWPRLLAGHRSAEGAHSALLDHLGLDPVLDLGMRLGEGSGATAALSVLQLAAAAHAEMATFAEAGVSDG